MAPHKFTLLMLTHVDIFLRTAVTGSEHCRAAKTLTGLVFSSGWGAAHEANPLVTGWLTESASYPGSEFGTLGRQNYFDIRTRDVAS